MEFTLDDDQQALAGTAAQFLSEQAPPAFVREMVEGGGPSGTGTTPESWQQLVDLGWVGLLVPERDGGAGMGMLEMMVLLEAMGRLPLPGPFLEVA